jgi:TolA-binding protein
MRGVSLILLLAAAAHADEPEAYFKDLARLGIVDPKTGSPAALDAELAAGEAALERGDLAAAAATFYAVVDSPRFADFSDTVAYQNAEYDLVVALAAAGAHDDALATAERVLRRGPKAPYFAVAHRRAIDVALASRRYEAVLARLAAIPADPLPAEAAGERSYLAGRAAYDKGDLDGAERLLTAVTRRSRLYSSALYLRGVLKARQGKLKDAVDAFCEIVQSPDNDRFSFYIDERYFGLKDLAQLGAGRIAHEEKRYDDAYFHYFQIPDDSERLPEALFEAAWSMYQKRELRTARELVDELIKDFPAAPSIPEAMLLAGYIELADCKFEAARKRFDALAADVRALVDAVVRLRGSTRARQALLTRPTGATTEDRVLAMMRRDPALVRLNEALKGLVREAQVAPHAVDEWRDLMYRVASRKGQVAAGAPPLLGDIRRLREDVQRERAAVLRSEAAPQRLPELDHADAELAALEAELEARSPDADPALKARMEKEIAETARLAERTRVLASSFDQRVDDLARRELLRVHAELVRLFEKARLGKVDAVIGEKSKLEKEIENLAAGTYLPPSIGRAYKQGLIGDTEEYWPPEAEVWEDEYERWR